MDYNRHEPMVYRYYDYLQNNHYGKDNGVKRDILAETMGVKLQEQKAILATINESDTLEKLISTSGSIYMCRTKEECVTAYMNEIRSGITRINKGKAMAKKAMRNMQGKIRLGKYYKDFVEVFEE